MGQALFVALAAARNPARPRRGGLPAEWAAHTMIVSAFGMDGMTRLDVTNEVAAA
jgi:hypothetical protein